LGILIHILLDFVWPIRGFLIDPSFDQPC